MENNKAAVKIYGREYVLSGEKTRDLILKAANMVDKQMHDVAISYRLNDITDIAVLAAVNIADEYFDSLLRIEELKNLNVQFENEAKHYSKLWDEEKKAVAKEKKKSISVSGERQQVGQELLDIEEKYKDLESNFFDLQMENVKLKKELEEYTK